MQRLLDWGFWSSRRRGGMTGLAGNIRAPSRHQQSQLRRIDPRLAYRTGKLNPYLPVGALHIELGDPVLLQEIDQLAQLI
jgi:hypothetical protein